MDQDIFRRTYREVNECFCAYEKSVLTNKCECSQAERFCIAEREGVRCKSDAAQAQCLEYLEFLRAQAHFALRSTEERSTIPHGKAMKVQIGGLRGLLAALEPDTQVPDSIKDVTATLDKGRRRYGEFQDFPLQAIIQHIAAYKGKQRSRRRRKD